MRRGDFQVAACGRDRVAFSYDHTWGVARAARDLEPGDITPRLPTKALAESVPGQEIYLRTRVGPVVVERAVHVVEPARLGRGVIVRAQDGNVFAVPALAPTP